MADKDGNRIAKNYNIDTPFLKSSGFYVKGMNDVDWGMKTRLSKIFRPESGNTVMLAFDHGYFMGSTAGLERLDISMPPLIPYVDVLMATRGAFRTSIPPEHNKGIALRASGGSSMIDEDLSQEIIAVNMEDAIRLNASCVAVQTFIGAPGEKSSLDNLCKTIDAGNRYGIPTLGVVAVGKDMERSATFFKLATRIVAELGAQIIKTYYCDDFEEIVAACPVPIVVAGGKKVLEKDALIMAYKSIQCGAKGIDMGRNIFQSDCPIGMAKAIGAIVHEKATAEAAYDIYLEEKSIKK